MCARSRFLPLGILGLLAIPLDAAAHHSVGAVYDVGTIVELEGPVTRVLWRNPHVRFTVRVRDDRGRDADWNVETHSVGILR